MIYFKRAEFWHRTRPSGPSAVANWLFSRATSLCRFDIWVLDRKFAKYHPPTVASTTRPTANLGNCCMWDSSSNNQFNQEGMADSIIQGARAMPMLRKKSIQR